MSDTQEFKTNLIKVQDTFLTMISNQMSGHRITLDTYQKNCVLHAVSAIKNVLDSKGLTFNDIDQSSVSGALLTVAALKLNPVASPREVYFQLRNVNRNGQWSKIIEVGVEGDGNDAILRRFGAGINAIGRYWIVREGDEFKPPVYKGMAVVPPEWTPKGIGSRALAVVYPIIMEGGKEEYYIAYRDDVKANLQAHISNNMMNETFGICVDRHKANEKQKADIAAKKKELMDMTETMSIDEILDEETLWPWISPAWREPQSRELMIIRKMRNNIVKKIPKDFGCEIASESFDTHADRDEIKDAGSDPEQPALPPKVIDISPEEQAQETPPAAPQKLPEAKTPPKTQVKPPRTRPQPESEKEPDPEPDIFASAAQAIEEREQIGF